MEASAVPRAAPAGVSGVFQSPHLLRLASDARLVTLVRERNAGAFEAVYNRHHRAILSFCRHMLGDAQEAEDALQHTFLAAYNDLVSSKKQIHLRAWLFKIARNRCYSMLRSRREEPANDVADQVTEGLATQVQRRQDLRDLVVDMQRLPEDQRAALVLAEVDTLSHEEVAAALGVPREKVKALVFQARESLLASRAARETDCAEIREQLATQRGGALRRGNLRRHLRECPGCRAFRRDVEHQRQQLALVLPVVPTLALKPAVLGGGAGASLGLSGAALSTALKSGLLKGLASVLLAGVGTAGTVVAAQTLLSPPTVTGTRVHRRAESLGHSGSVGATTGMSALDSIGTPERIPKTLPWLSSPSVPAASTGSAAPPAAAATLSIDPLSLLRAFAPVTTTATILVRASPPPSIIGSAPFATAPLAGVAPAGGAAPPGEAAPPAASTVGQTPAAPPVSAPSYPGSAPFHNGQGAGPGNRGQGPDGEGGGSHGDGPGAIGGPTRGGGAGPGPGGGLGTSGGLGEKGSDPGSNRPSAGGYGFGANGNGPGVGGGGADGSGVGSGSAAGGLGRGSASGPAPSGSSGGSSSSETGSGSQAPADSGAGGSSGGTGQPTGGPGSGGGASGLAGSVPSPGGFGSGAGSGSGSGGGASGSSAVSGNVRPAVAEGNTGASSSTAGGAGASTPSSG